MLASCRLSCACPTAAAHNVISAPSKIIFFMLAEIPSHAHHGPKTPHVSRCGRPAGNRGALSSYCTCTRRPNAHHASFWPASLLCLFVSLVLPVVFLSCSGGLSIDEAGPVPSSGARPLRVLSLLSYCCGLPDGGGGTGAPCPPSSPRRSRILACIASNFACWSGVNTARILACSP